jgi:hypothetical protein
MECQPKFGLLQSYEKGGVPLISGNAKHYEAAGTGPYFNIANGDRNGSASICLGQEDREMAH